MINPDPLKAADDLDKWAAGLEQRARSYARLQERMDATTASAASPDGSIRVTVDSNGVPTAITLSERSRALEPTALSAGIMSVMRAAQAALRQRVQVLVAETVPAEDQPARDIVAQYERRFPDPAPEPAADREVTREMRIGQVEDDAAPPPPRPNRTDATDDDWEDRGFLR
ncbi:YbaB/EbfC family nucleoid-associated protein [Saccharothrix yanglingensis]|uniref:YbaB/EbfC DNA-binding family protein n=1 Tax=Saccharothrix yanglingensis TaxID=659496 RepID=A0ABU0X557_9PSEU|nr:YbaB/EbfC family nucleoid-associated protein [Saccharothrix yanglingensis]MDQ2586742.1 hypothetical protein [Saccharothrix yanglingensis]